MTAQSNIRSMSGRSLAKFHFRALVCAAIVAACSPQSSSAETSSNSELNVDYQAAQKQPPATTKQQPPVTQQKLPPGRGSMTDSVRSGKAPALAERVWLNTATGIYHCTGSASYGTTKDGKYISELTARSQGHRPARDNVCGPTLVWVNTTSSIYHCPGSANYGTTKEGKFMTEVDAKKASVKPSGGKVCP